MQLVRAVFITPVCRRRHSAQYTGEEKKESANPGVMIVQPDPECDVEGESEGLAEPSVTASLNLHRVSFQII